MKKSKSGTVNGYLPNMQVFFQGGIPFLIKVKPAKQGVEFPRTIGHCRSGEPGECGSCANALAGMDYGLAPLCLSSDSTYVAVHKWVKNTRTSYGIGTIYSSNQGAFQKKYDHNKAALIASEDAEGIVKLRAYTRHKNKPHKSGPSGQHTGGGGGKTTLRTRTSLKGARRRLARSGLGLKLPD